MKDKPWQLASNESDTLKTERPKTNNYIRLDIL